MKYSKFIELIENKKDFSEVETAFLMKEIVGGCFENRKPIKFDDKIVPVEYIKCYDTTVNTEIIIHYIYKIDNKFYRFSIICFHEKFYYNPVEVIPKEVIRIRYEEKK